MRPEGKETDYGKFNPPIWACVAFQGFLLAQEHLDRLHEVRRLREEIDPEMCYSVLFDAAGEVVRNADGKPKRGTIMKEPGRADVQAFTLSAVSGRAVAMPSVQPEPPHGMRLAAGLDSEQLKAHRRRWSGGPES